MRITALPVLLAGGSVLFLSACLPVLSGTAHCFGQVDLERTVEHVLEQEGTMEILVVDCPDSLQIRTHALTRCLLHTGDGSLIGVTVEVVEAVGDRGRIDVAVDDAGS
ncbi:DUF4333 domain-containing protein [Nocardia sp. NBC_00416]|uniref:DUF4333 domain-containing protein n=1 Tax=Nocardia sp. NBC_00416 TaxID=2975991 RepID=UPI002E1B7325